MFELHLLNYLLSLNFIMNILFVVPHCDDEVLGFGGTINKYVESGHNVSVCFVQSRNCSRSEIQIKNSADAKEVLGYKDAIYLNLDRDTFSNNINLVIKTVEDLILSKTPDVLYTTFISDNHQHHKILYNAISVATRPQNNNNIKKIYAGEVISSFNQSYGVERNKFTPNYYEVLTDHNLNKKIEALKKYKLEIQNYPHSRSPETLKAWAIVRGAECNSSYAEAFINR
ncbi:MAG: PIG-L family deacetylase [Proteobacteria bacterium]|nr:PIG-L family deacetylase [Pseudomonadota bacterium]